MIFQNTKLQKLAIVGVLSMSLGACSAVYRNHGYVPPEEDLELVTVGVDTRDSIEDVLGVPSAGGVLSDGDWYYVSSRWKHFGWQKPKPIERTVLAVRFDDKGTVTNVEKFGLEDGKVVVLSRRVTESNIKGISLIGQLLGNLGNFGGFGGAVDADTGGSRQ
ncbi:MAG: outer membrane protein assembly factor BamE [Halocynthiibacter sp.]